MRVASATGTARRLGLLVATLLLAGCGGGDPAAAPDGGTPTTAPTPTAPAPTAEEPLACVAGVEEVPGADGIGEDAAMDAYCLVADLVREHGFTELVRPGELDAPADVAPLRNRLSEAGRQRLDHAVDAWLSKGDPAAGDRLAALVLHDVTVVPRGYLLDPPWTYDTEVGAPRARVLPDGRLELEVTSTSGVVLARRGDDSGRHSLLPVTRDATYVLEPGGDRGWLLDDWTARHTYGEVRLVAG